MNEKISKILVYRYLFKVKNSEKDSVCVKYVSDVKQAHDDFIRALLKDDNVLSALREYVCEIDCSFVGSVDHVKVEVPDLPVEDLAVVENSEVVK